VFDGFGRMVLAIAAIGPNKMLDLRPASAQAKALREAGARLSQRLGSMPAA
jgi:DNA-binding IclR family transcriptional regulator